ncbi:MAG: hypothetical protein Q9222_005844 [Ikaeria aurantiellina]
MSAWRHNPSEHEGAEVEEAAQILEQFVDGTSRTPFLSSNFGGTTLDFMTPDYPNTVWPTGNNPRGYDESRELLREILDSLPDADMIRHLYKIFITRCQAPIGNVVHIPTFMEHTEKLCSRLHLPSPEARVEALSETIPIDLLSCHLLAVGSVS